MKVRFWNSPGSLILSPRSLLAGVIGHTDTPSANSTCLSVSLEAQCASRDAG